MKLNVGFVGLTHLGINYAIASAVKGFNVVCFDENLDVVFYNETLDENHWGCELNIDDANGKDLIIVPTIED